MATPDVNSVPATEFDPIDGNGGSVQYGVKWGGAYGTGVALTYSFATDEKAFPSGYGDGEPDALYPLLKVEKNAVRTALAEWSEVAGITFTEVVDNRNKVGELRFGVTDNAGDESAHAYLPDPGNSPDAGDVWFKNGSWHEKLNARIKLGSYDYVTALHEIGHAIGLKHPFESPDKIQNAYDNYAYSIMSYTAGQWGNDNYASFYPTTPMYYDLVAIQGMYGRGVHEAGDTVYRFKDGKNYWQTIDDSGGIDTIVHIGRGKAVIDLNEGGWSDLGKTINFSNSNTKWTVAIGPNTLIENATGGSGKDKITGNAFANTLSGGRGKDVLTGGDGADSFRFDSKLSAGNVDTIVDFVAGEDAITLAEGLFAGLALGAVSQDVFDLHFDYTDGVLSFEGRPFARIKGAPTFDDGDLVVV
jgi:serralysin